MKLFYIRASDADIAGTYYSLQGEQLFIIFIVTHL